MTTGDTGSPTTGSATTAVTGGATRAAGPQDPGELADQVRAVVLAVPGVVAMHAGAFGEVATLLPGRRVRGVRVSEDGRAEVHVVASSTAPLPRTASAVHHAVSPLVPGPVHVAIGDVMTPAEVARREHADQQPDGA